MDPFLVGFWRTASEEVGLDAFRIRETGTNGEDDFTLTEAGDGTLATFTGANDGACRTWYDISGNDNHAVQTTALNQPLLVESGVVLEGLKFDGTNDYLSAGARVTTGSVAKLFVSAWVYLPSSGLTCDVVDEYDFGTNQRQWRLRVYSGQLRLELDATGTNNGLFFRSRTTSSFLPVGAWVHVAASYSDGDIELLVNGSVAVDTLTHSGTVSSLHDGFSHLFIGASSNSGTPSGLFQGTLSDVRIAEGTAADDHATNIASVMAGTYEGSPVAHYPGTIPTP